MSVGRRGRAPETGVVAARDSNRATRTPIADRVAKAVTGAVMSGPAANAVRAATGAAMKAVPIAVVKVVTVAVTSGPRAGVVTAAMSVGRRGRAPETGAVAARDSAHGMNVPMAMIRTRVASSPGPAGTARGCQAVKSAALHVGKSQPGTTSAAQTGRIGRGHRISTTT